jgi:hypothetical protein
VLKRLAVVIPEVEEALEKVSFPVWSMVRSEDPVEEAITSGLILATPVTPTVAAGVVDPTPSLPFEPKLNMSAPVEEAIASGYKVVEVPITVRVAIGDEVPIPTLPLAKIAKSDAPVDDATWNGLRLDVLVAWTLNTKVVFVALTPANEPLSKNALVVIAEADDQRASLPVAPPASAVVIPRDDVATHLVVVPVV